MSSKTKSDKNRHFDNIISYFSQRANQIWEFDWQEFVKQSTQPFLSCSHHKTDYTCIMYRYLTLRKKKVKFSSYTV